VETGGIQQGVLLVLWWREEEEWQEFSAEQGK
jgi:hypothetical protein